LKSSFLSESRAFDQNLIVEDFSRLERRLVILHFALIEALLDSDNLPAEVKRRATLSVLRGYLRILQIGLILSPVLAKRKYFYWHGLVFINKIEGRDRSEGAKAALVMLGLVPGVSAKAADAIGSRKLGEVFKLLARDGDLSGFISLLNFSSLVRSKPKDWLSAATEVVAQTDRNTFYLRMMLDAAFRQFRDEVNTTSKRSELKKLVAIVKMKRDLKKQRPGEKDIQQFLERMDAKNMFNGSKSRKDLRDEVEDNSKSD
jgi:hypothetical protein